MDEQLHNNRDTSKMMASQNDQLWTSLPNELLADIFEYLSFSDLQQIRLVCKDWRNVTYMPKFFNKFKLMINKLNQNSVCEYFKNDKNFPNTMAYRTLKLSEVGVSDDIFQVLKCLGSTIRSLILYKAEVLTILDECFPKLEELDIIMLSQKGNILVLDLRKFKHLKSLAMDGVTAPQFAKVYLLKSLVEEPTFKMEKLYLALHDKEDEELVIRAVQYHGRFLKHLELVLRLKPTLFSQWKQAFSLFKKLETLCVTGDSSYQFLTAIIESLPKETALRDCNLSGGMEVDDKLLKLIVEKWSGSLKDINLSFCNKITDEGVQHLGKLKHNLKVLHVPYCKRVTADRLLDGLAAEKNTKLKYLMLDDTSTNESIDVLVERLPELTHLILDSCRKSVDDYTLQSIFQYQLKVQHLNLNDCVEISNSGLVGFGLNPAPLSNLKGLQSLSLRGCNKISDRALIKAFKLNQLRQLVFGYCHRITSRGIKEVVKNCPALEDLSITSCSQIDDKAILLIVQGLKRLRYLNVSNCTTITGKSLDYIIIEHCKCLKELHMCGIESLHYTELSEKFLKIKDLKIKVEIADADLVW